MFDAIESELRAAMLLTGSKDLDALHATPRVLGCELRAWLTA
jgi:isopentenyl diphosphate isomerase/L-lactate dehydrogenase-like FMN-dependent dehydrogenase